jgi:hypothetical protein
VITCSTAYLELHHRKPELLPHDFTKRYRAVTKYRHMVHFLRIQPICDSVSPKRSSIRRVIGVRWQTPCLGHVPLGKLSVILSRSVPPIAASRGQVRAPCVHLSPIQTVVSVLLVTYTTPGHSNMERPLFPFGGTMPFCVADGYEKVA